MSVDGENQMKLYYPRDLEWCATADPHLGHGNILLYCRRYEFMSQQERELADAWYGDGEPRDRKPHLSRDTIRRHDDGIIANINATVPVDAILAIVGDFCWGPDDDVRFHEVAKRYREAIKCKHVHLIFGNHDRRCMADLFTWVNEKVTVVVRGHNTQQWRRADHIVLDHEAKWFWDGRHKGSRHYYGHTHARGEEELDRLAPGRFSMDVGIDNARRILGQYRPFKDSELEAIMTKRTGFGCHNDSIRSGHIRSHKGGK